MSYSALPGNGIPYHIDGTVVKCYSSDGMVEATLNSTQMGELNDEDYTLVNPANITSTYYFLTFFFPEERELEGVFAVFAAEYNYYGPLYVKGSNDTTNGFDGTWETASAPGGYNTAEMNQDSWRKNIKAGGFSTAYKTWRLEFTNGGNGKGMTICHLYGSKGSGETPDDIIFLDAEDSDAEFAASLDYGDRPAGTSVTHQIKLQNTSATLTANTIDISVTHDNWLLSTSGSGPWSASLEISSLGPGVKSSIIYVKNTTDEPPADLGPQRVPIIVEVTSWT
jgi:hypothetical protein